MVGLPHEVLALHVEELFEPAVDKHVAALPVLQPDHRRAVVEDRVELRLAAAHPVVRHPQPGRETSQQSAQQCVGGQATDVAEHRHVVLPRHVPEAEQAQSHHRRPDTAPGAELDRSQDDRQGEQDGDRLTRVVDPEPERKNAHEPGPAGSQDSDPLALRRALRQAGEQSPVKRPGVACWCSGGHVPCFHVAARLRSIGRRPSDLTTRGRGGRHRPTCSD